MAVGQREIGQQDVGLMAVEPGRGLGHQAQRGDQFQFRVGGNAAFEEMPDLGVVLEQRNAPAQGDRRSGRDSSGIGHGGGASLVGGPPLRPPIFMG
ncbi:hypothetical protein D9M72_640690 [compost metagenome]